MKSVHRHHKYRVGNKPFLSLVYLRCNIYVFQVGISAGSGYCDCGDVEAWKSNPACELHAETFEAGSKGSEYVLALGTF